MGGGVVLDLSHEPNYIEWLAGPLQVVACGTAVIPALHVDTEGVADVILRTTDWAPVSVHLHAYDRNCRREFQVVAAEGTVHADLITGELTLHGRSGKHQWSDDVTERDSLYRRQAKLFLRCIDEGGPPRCSGEDALQTLRTCLDALESARCKGLEAGSTTGK